MRPRVDILHVADCPGREGALDVVTRIAVELLLEPEIHVVEVTDADAANRLRFLGSPTVRVGERDVEPGADARSDYALCCRLYRSEHGPSGQPAERWVRDRLAEAMS